MMMVMLWRKYWMINDEEECMMAGIQDLDEWAENSVLLQIGFHSPLLPVRMGDEQSLPVFICCCCCLPP
jgi:hypothetical protein